MSSVLDGAISCFCQKRMHKQNIPIIYDDYVNHVNHVNYVDQVQKHCVNTIHLWPLMQNCDITDEVLWITFYENCDLTENLHWITFDAKHQCG